ncbi:hypothetical protein PGTUg99_030764 [Puccinia graminis f. sp. tritici]|uniref:Uncharacterized protein n=1 Tax=Puccinia graminis f. sp. tritici TaxID=56615 RepID=A0A5B0SE71_PUCGR|nr:hypothetical protein PGTUg99_030764 [Puccinia graminis f. sp. tritici]
MSLVISKTLCAFSSCKSRTQKWKPAFLARPRHTAKKKLSVHCQQASLRFAWIPVLIFDLVEELGKAVVEELIERDFFDYRPVQLPHFARDLDPCHSLPTLTALSEPALRAMERLIEDLKQEVIK